MRTVSFEQIKDQDLRGQVWAMPTDTIPGLSCLALDQDAISRMDVVKNRTPDKSYIVLIGSLEQLDLFGIQPLEKHKRCLNRFWPGPVSVVIPGVGQQFSHLDGVVEGLAFRLPDDEQIRNLCLEIGPLVSTSANLSGEPPIMNISEIARCFDGMIDFVVNEYKEIGEPSTLIKILR